MVTPVLPKYVDKKYPSYLKGLVETHARAKGDVGRLSRLAEEVQAALSRTRADVESSARLIERFDRELSAAPIVPIHAWRLRYGKRGALREYILEVLRRVTAWKTDPPLARPITSASLAIDGKELLRFQWR